VLEMPGLPRVDPAGATPVQGPTVPGCSHLELERQTGRLFRVGRKPNAWKATAASP
jgi:hypothetical protein